MRIFRDGPLTRSEPETIRYATGRCAVGLLLVASSGKGIVSIMVRDAQARLLRDLDARFPKARLVRDEKGMKTVLARVARYIAAPFRPFPLALDIRGTELQQRVWSEVRKIPFGETSTYSRIAEAIGTFPEVSLPRQILRLIAQISIALEVDGHRSDLVCARAAQAKAAYDSADEVDVNHVGEVAEMVFAHRVHSVPFGKGGPNLGEVISRMVGQD